MEEMKKKDGNSWNFRVLFEAETFGDGKNFPLIIFFFSFLVKIIVEISIYLYDLITYIIIYFFNVNLEIDELCIKANKRVRKKEGRKKINGIDV